MKQIQFAAWSHRTTESWGFPRVSIRGDTVHITGKQPGDYSILDNSINPMFIQTIAPRHIFWQHRRTNVTPLRSRHTKLTITDSVDVYYETGAHALFPGQDPYYCFILQ